MNLAKQFHQQISHSFNLADLEQLAFTLGIDWDELKGFTKSAKIRSLIRDQQRRLQLPQLIAHLHQERPHVAWPDAAQLAAALTTATPSDPQQRNRQNILNNIHYTWIEGVLQPALHNDVALALGMSYQPEALNRPQRSLYPEEQPIPPDTSLGEIFAARGRALLILGEPASGKTIALLQLLQELLTAAQADPAEPIPIVLNLSSWARERAALTDWIVEELLVQYQAPRQLSRDWLANHQLTLLLDGLDEVAADHREACIEAINSFKADHAADMVVCSRLTDYEQLQARLNLSTAIRIQPLTPSQIDNYLASFGAPLADLRQAVATDDDWRELAQSPLMLNLMAYTFSETPLPKGGSLAAKQSQLFSVYIKRSLHRRPLPKNGSYDEQTASTWLHHIASQLHSRNQALFQIERLQANWLPNPGSFRWLSKLILGLIDGLIIGLIIGLINELVTESFFGLINGLVIGLAFGLFGGLYGGGEHKVELVEEVHWHLPSFSLLRVKVKKGLVSGLVFGLSIGLVLGLAFGLSSGLSVGLSVYLLSGLIIGLTAFIQIHETRQHTQPNQSIGASWRNAQYIGLCYGLIFGLLFGVISKLMFGLMFGLILGLRQYGGRTVVQHYVLRWLLARQGVLPFPFEDRKLIAYLDEMAARLLLRRVGGGWMFIHRTLLEFLADDNEFEKLMKDLDS